jgi:hypothetical protein
MTTQIKAELLINLSNWQKGLTKANKQMTGFGKSMKKISGAINGALALVGLNAIGDSLMDMAKAADEDATSMRILNKLLENSWKATDEQTRAVDDFIQKTSVQVGIVDDKLRPAFGKIATTIKNPTKAMEIFALAIDVAVGTGKDLNIVALNMAKFFGGQKTALDKLVPGIKNAGDKMGYLTTKYKGAAEEGAGAFDKIDVAMENIKEQFGAYLLPYAEKFAKYLQTPEAQAAIDDWVRKFGKLLEITEDIINGIVYTLSSPQEKMMIRGREAQARFDAQTSSRNQAFGGNYQSAQKGLAGKVPAGYNVSMNVTVNGVTNASQVVTELQKLANRKGIPLSKLLR